MDFSLTDDERMIQEVVRHFAETELKPQAPILDREHRMDLGNLAKMAELGLMGMNIPETYGGAAVGVLPYSLAMTEVGRACSATAVTMSVTNMVAEVICSFGTEEQKKKYVTRLCSGEYSAGAFGLTESMAGSDLGGMKTYAVREGDHFRLNGSKIFITSAEYSGVLVIWAVTDKEAPKNRRLSAFLVEKGTPGLTIGKAEEKMGQRGSATNELVLEDCLVPAENMLGKEGEGIKIALMALDGGRIGIGSMAIGIGLEAIDYARDYAKERMQFNEPIASFQAIQWQLADTYSELKSAQLMVLQAAWLKQNKLPFTMEASMAKLLASERANQACYRAIQILGGNGYIAEYPVERLYRDARVTTIYEGTSEIQRLVIARNVLVAS
ncbi:MAG: acyl-CoA dehydrogenase family protein [Deltaproteobacteria bacterium]|nr:acyl-CoA dehydrogenase family protein [Candidatus Anaeroferrophillus wilburensis]MBN2888328.1 acyl-CoA dehydrogenase family protein [Deltaproteobacteria bacterium]